MPGRHGAAHSRGGTAARGQNQGSDPPAGGAVQNAVGELPVGVAAFGAGTSRGGRSGGGEEVVRSRGELAGRPRQRLRPGVVRPPQGTPVAPGIRAALRGEVMPYFAPTAAEITSAASPV